MRSFDDLTTHELIEAEAVGALEHPRRAMLRLGIGFDDAMTALKERTVVREIIAIFAARCPEVLPPALAGLSTSPRLTRTMAIDAAWAELGDPRICGWTVFSDRARELYGPMHRSTIERRVRELRTLRRQFLH